MTDDLEFHKGDRIRMVRQPGDANPIPPGTEGTVLRGRLVDLGPGDVFEQYTVDWDDGRKLFVATPPDVVQRCALQVGSLVVMPEATFMPGARWAISALERYFDDGDGAGVKVHLHETETGFYATDDLASIADDTIVGSVTADELAAIVAKAGR